MQRKLSRSLQNALRENRLRYSQIGRGGDREEKLALTAEKIKLSGVYAKKKDLTPQPQRSPTSGYRRQFDSSKDRFIREVRKEIEMLESTGKRKANKSVVQLSPVSRIHGARRKILISRYGADSAKNSLETHGG